MSVIPTRIAGPDPPARIPLTRDEVLAWMVAVEKDAAAAIRAGTKSPSTTAVSRWPDVYVKDYDTRKYLRGYVWCKAHRHSFTAMCNGRDGWSLRTGRRRVEEALDAITALLAFEAAAGGADVLVAGETLQPPLVNHAAI